MLRFHLVPNIRDKKPCGVVSNVRHKVPALQRTYLLRSCRHARTSWRTSWRALIFDGRIYARTRCLTEFMEWTHPSFPSLLLNINKQERRIVRFLLVPSIADKNRVVSSATSVIKYVRCNGRTCCAHVGTRALLDGRHDLRWFSMDAFMLERTSSLADRRHIFVYSRMVPAIRALV
jgi:hypothetical protein